MQKINSLVGIWQSNEAMTLASMNETEGITDRAREILEKDFFGKLITEYKKDSYRAYFKDPEDYVAEMYEFRPYQIIEETNDYFLIEAYDILFEELVQRKLFKEDGCYYELVSGWEFREYFCRVE